VLDKQKICAIIRLVDRWSKTMSLTQVGDFYEPILGYLKMNVGRMGATKQELLEFINTMGVRVIRR
jgi:hypothetical protein